MKTSRLGAILSSCSIPIPSDVSSLLNELVNMVLVTNKLTCFLHSDRFCVQVVGWLVGWLDGVSSPDRSHFPFDWPLY